MISSGTSRAWLVSTPGTSALPVHPFRMIGASAAGGEGEGQGQGQSEGRMAMQKLHDVCKATLPLSSAASAASTHSVQRVRAILNSIKSSDVGLDEAWVQQQQEERVGGGDFGMFGGIGRKGRHAVSARRRAPPISYLHVYECEAFSMGVFCLPKSAVIPLHNHPGMTVFSKLLYGSMHVKAYDWVTSLPADGKSGEDAYASPSTPRMAKLVADEIATFPCETSVLHPTSGGNIHAFTAVTPCAILDVLAPPYSALTGRNCTYYREYPVGNAPRVASATAAEMIPDKQIDESDHHYRWLEEFQPPDDFVVHRGIYRGPKVAP